MIEIDKIQKVMIFNNKIIQLAIYLIDSLRINYRRDLFVNDVWHSN